MQKLNKREENDFLKNLYSIGFGRVRKVESKLNKKFLFNAFQRRFRQGLINGKSDKECLLISKNLLKS